MIPFIQIFAGKKNDSGNTGHEADEATKHGRVGPEATGDAKVMPDAGLTEGQQQDVTEQARQEAFKTIAAPASEPATAPALQAPKTSVFGTEKATSGSASAKALLERKRCEKFWAEIPEGSLDIGAAQGPAPSADTIDFTVDESRGLLQRHIQAVGNGPQAGEKKPLFETLAATLDAASALRETEPYLARYLARHARAALDIGLDFTPGASLVKDLVSLTTRQNPITGDAIGDVEAGLIAAGIVVPGALSGIGKVVGKNAKHLAKAMSAAAAHGGQGAVWAQRVVEPMQKAAHFVDGLLAGLGEGERVSGEAVRLLSRGADHAVDLVGKSAAVRRASPGKVVMTRSLYDSERLVLGQHGNAGLVPKEIGEKLSGRYFKDFDGFREEFWRTVAGSKYAGQFSRSNNTLMKQGLAPKVAESQAIGKRGTYELHHVMPIVEGGSVYDLSNLAIVTPQFHINYFHLK